jgi:3alpha(or 20beta)-hydroxysteroid dehydrogenase
MRLRDTIAIITGGARGTGARTARRFIDEGARVVVADILDDQGEALCAVLGANARYCRTDVTSERDWAQLVRFTEREFGVPTVLVNNAAILHMAPLHAITVEQFDRLYRVNQLGPVLGIAAVAPGMRAAGGGSIVNVGSSDGMMGQDLGLLAYGSTKWALRGITRMAALELARDGIRVNTVAPDGGNPQMSAEFMPPGIDPERAMRDHTAQILKPPPGVERMDEVANMIAFLASGESSGCTGGDYTVDGGLTAGLCSLPRAAAR